MNSIFLRRAFKAFNDYMLDQKISLIGKESCVPLESKLMQHEISRIVKEIPAVLDENDSSIMRIADITTSIKELAGAGPVYPQREDINSLIRQCVEITRSSWSDVAALDLDLSADLPEVNCISCDINQVFISIIMNAVDSIELMRERNGVQGKGTIRIASGSLDGKLRIVISDNGTGIENDYLEKIFKPFFTTKKPGKGTGQGLAVALRIMNEHHGSITVESFSDRGTVFVVSLPLDI